MSWTITWLANLGVAGCSRVDRQGIAVANVAACFIALAAIAFALMYMFIGEKSLVPLIVVNLTLALGALVTPFFHRFGRAASTVWIFAISAVALTWITSLLGKDSGVMINFIGVTPIAFAILGREHAALVAVLSSLAAILIIVSGVLFPEPKPGIYSETSFQQLVYSSAIVTAISISFAVVYYAFSLAKEAKNKLEGLMRSIMPDDIVDRLSDNEEGIIETYETATVLIADIVKFVTISNKIGSKRTVAMLDDLFTTLDAFTETVGVEKIKTIGDAYLAVAGVPREMPNPERAMTDFGLGAIDIARQVGERHGVDLKLRVGMASGSLIAGVLGRSKYAFDIWGAPVNLAARLEAIGQPGYILTTEQTKDALINEYSCERLGSENTGLRCRQGLENKWGKTLFKLSVRLKNRIANLMVVL